MTALPEPSRALIDRVSAMLPNRHLREVRMFGALLLMVDDSMAVAAHQDGSLLVRVDPIQDAQLLEDPGASRAEMGAGRFMGVGWIRVEATALVSDPALAAWVEQANRHLAQRKSPRSRALG